jgi:hypothetical protein
MIPMHVAKHPSYEEKIISGQVKIPSTENEYLSFIEN